MRMFEDLKIIKRFQIVQLPIAIFAYFLALLKYLQLNDIRIYNSDLLYIPTLFKDITEWGGRISEWRLTPSPYFFPDMAFFFPLATIIENWQIASLIYAVVQIILFTIGWCLVGQFLYLQKQRFQNYVTFIFLVSAILLTIPNTNYILRPQFSITLHFGVMVCLPFVLFMGWRLINQPEKIINIVGFLALFTLISFSDPITIVHIALPFISALIFLWLLKRIPLKSILIIVTLQMTGLLLAEILTQWLIKFPAAPPIVKGGSMAILIGDALTELVLATTLLWEGNDRIFLILLILASILHLVICLSAIRFTVAKRDFNANLLFISVFSLTSFLLAVIAVIMTGIFHDLEGLRYLHPVTVLPVYSLLPVSFFVLQRLRVENFIFAPVALFILLINVGAFTGFDELQKYRDYYPPLVACIDEVAAERGVYSGVGGYWDAKYVSALSKQNVFISQVYANFQPYIWINNPNWYQRFPPAFVLFDTKANLKLDMSMIINRYGYPEEIVSCEDHELWFYDRPYDQPFQIYFQDHPNTVNWCQPGARDSIPAYVWPGKIGTNLNSSLIADNLSGNLSSAELYNFPPGQYEIELLYEYSGTLSGARIGEFSVRLDSIGEEKGDQVWHREPLLSDSESVKISFEIKEGTNVFFEVFFNGAGVLSLQQFELQKTSHANCQ